jgi:hypothetical protein
MKYTIRGGVEHPFSERVSEHPRTSLTLALLLAAVLLWILLPSNARRFFNPSALGIFTIHSPDNNSTSSVKKNDANNPKGGHGKATAKKGGSMSVVKVPPLLQPIGGAGGGGGLGSSAATLSGGGGSVTGTVGSVVGGRGGGLVLPTGGGAGGGGGGSCLCQTVTGTVQGAANTVYKAVPPAPSQPSLPVVPPSTQQLTQPLTNTLAPVTNTTKGLL